MNTEVKICGLSTKDTVDAAVNHGAAFLGFVFFPPSPRNITPEEAAAISAHVPKEVQKVAVTVDITNGELEDILDAFPVDFIQLHGNENPQRIKEIKHLFNLNIIKAIPVATSADIAAFQDYVDLVDIILFDAKPPKEALVPGGNAVSFDWNILKDNDFSFPWMLSGGLKSSNVEEALAITSAPMIDVSSGVESLPGVKSTKKIESFLNAVKQHSCVV